MTDTDDIKKLIDRLREPSMWARHDSLVASSAVEELIVDDAPFKAADALEKLAYRGIYRGIKARDPGIPNDSPGWKALRRAQEDTYIAGMIHDPATYTEHTRGNHEEKEGEEDQS